MATTLVNPTSRGGNLDKLTTQQRIFVEELLASDNFCGTVAATKAGYKQPEQAAARLMKQKVIRAAIGKAIYERIHECKLEAAQVLRHLASALYLDPIELFEIVKTLDGTPTFRVKSLDQVPEHIRRCITKLKCKTRSYEDKDGGVSTETYVEIELMSKDAALALAMKHLGLGGQEGSVNLNFGDSVLMKLLEDVEGASGVIDGKVIEREAER